MGHIVPFSLEGLESLDQRLMIRQLPKELKQSLHCSVLAIAASEPEGEAIVESLPDLLECGADVNLQDSFNQLANREGLANTAKIDHFLTLVAHLLRLVIKQQPKAKGSAVLGLGPVTFGSLPAAVTRLLAREGAQVGYQDQIPDCFSHSLRGQTSFKRA